MNLFVNILCILRDLLNVKCKVGVKTKAHIFKKYAEILSILSDVFKLTFHN